MSSYISGSGKWRQGGTGERVGGVDWMVDYYLRMVWCYGSYLASEKVRAVEDGTCPDLIAWRTLGE